VNLITLGCDEIDKAFTVEGLDDVLKVFRRLATTSKILLVQLNHRKCAWVLVKESDSVNILGKYVNTSPVNKGVAPLDRCIPLLLPILHPKGVCPKDLFTDVFIK